MSALTPRGRFWLEINERASFSLGYDHRTFRRDKRGRNFNVVLGVGATRAAPDVQLTLRMPVGF